MKPTIGVIVHYVSYGTPGGEYGKECRAAVVTEVAPTRNPEGSWVVGLAVLNPTGFFFNQRCVNHEIPLPARGETELEEVAANHPGGTWHWPEEEE
ncbi:hypothetical protein AB0M57_04670 [Streptomyces sp. NPDC051597]|uniref:hypothetical protein n=1 Tax=Streptomyces sp. NPDC051597 TaxID=3155049 RepID=UPI003433E657